MKRFLLSLVTLAALSSSTYAAVVITFNNGVGGTTNKFLTSTGVSLTAGSSVRIGFFNAGGAASVSTEALITGSNSYSQLNNLFTPLSDSNRVGSGAVVATTANTGGSIRASATGNVSGQITGITNTYLPQNTRLYVWVANTPDPANATEWAIVTNASWLAPLDADPTDIIDAPLTMQTTQGGLEIKRGAVGSIKLAVVPEPTSLGLAALGLGAILRRRRA